ncbi:MAG: hypothetical protein M1826_006758 [Phylliscum demangeonii]|nr:MAG: hypothetical protein M1826_006758 [Phylliscum demangeonii]
MRCFPGLRLAPLLPLLLSAVVASPLPLARPGPPSERGGSFMQGALVGASATGVLATAGALVRQKQIEKKARQGEEEDLQRYLSEMRAQYQSQLQTAAAHDQAIHQKLREKIVELEGQTVFADTIRRSAVVDQILRANPSLDECIRPFLTARHAVEHEIFVPLDVWNEAANHCDEEHRHPQLRVQMDFLLLPSLGGYPPMTVGGQSPSPSPSPLSFLARARPAAAHSSVLSRLLSTARRGLHPLAHTRVAAAAGWMGRAKAVERSWVGRLEGALQRAER